MSELDTSGSGRNGGVKTLAIRLEPGMHQQLALIAQLQETTITDEIRTAIAERINALKARPEIAAKVKQALADIEQEAAVRRGAIAALFGETTPEPAPEPKQPASRPRGGRRGASQGGTAD